MSEDSENKLFPWEKLSEEELADYGVFRVLRRKFKHPMENKSGDFFVVNFSNAVHVIAETTDGRIVVVKQYRLGSESFSLELPGGIMDPGEDAIEAARRELAEETGFRGGHAELLGNFHQNPALQTNSISVALIKNCRRELATQFDEFEDMASTAITKSELIDAAKSGRITNCVTLAAILTYILI